jgi:hypothetical protein
VKDDRLPDRLCTGSQRGRQPAPRPVVNRLTDRLSTGSQPGVSVYIPAYLIYVLISAPAKSVEDATATLRGAGAERRQGSAVGGLKAPQMLTLTS